jgi:hypothetical protein
MPEENDELVAGGQVAAAGIAAATAEPDPAKRQPAARRAVRAEAKRVKLELTDEDCSRIASEVVDMIDQRGGFDPPPEAVTAPAPAVAAAAGQDQPAAQPRKQTWAERFRS